MSQILTGYLIIGPHPGYSQIRPFHPKESQALQDDRGSQAPLVLQVQLVTPEAVGFLENRGKSEIKVAGDPLVFPEVQVRRVLHSSEHRQEHSCHRMKLTRSCKYGNPCSDKRELMEG